MYMYEQDFKKCGKSSKVYKKKSTFWYISLQGLKIPFGFSYVFLHTYTYKVKVICL